MCTTYTMRCLFDLKKNLIVFFFSNLGTYKDGLAPDGRILSDHMLLGSVVATILVLDNTTQVIQFSQKVLLFCYELMSSE